MNIAQQAAKQNDLPLGKTLGILIQNHKKGMITVAYRPPDETEPPKGEIP